jgi:hypothetical protein
MFVTTQLPHFYRALSPVVHDVACKCTAALMTFKLEEMAAIMIPIAATASTATQHNSTISEKEGHMRNLIRAIPHYKSHPR